MKSIDNELLSKHIYETGLSYLEIAESTKISRNTIYNVLCGQTCPSYSVMNNLANTLQLTQNDFIAIFFPEIQFKDDPLH